MDTSHATVAACAHHRSPGAAPGAYTPRAYQCSTATSNADEMKVDTCDQNMSCRRFAHGVGAGLSLLGAKRGASGEKYTSQSQKPAATHSTSRSRATTGATRRAVASLRPSDAHAARPPGCAVGYTLAPGTKK